ncbi:MAG: hypothetical protein KF835_14490 [Xanthobacteraceae bacterium]|nr:hypothetical protein [Xanthobacteraceae bacterium]MCW5675341.1 hypothetical protein [Xanthobacteraceae bacterium]
MKKNGSKSSSTLVPIILHQATGERPRAALFSAEDAKKAKEVAEKRSFAVIEVSSAELRKVANRLPRGTLSAPGLDVVPLTTLPLYNELMAANTATAFAQGKLEPKMAASWDAIKAGDLVIAQHTRADGWYEAIVLHRTNEIFHLKWFDYPRDPLFVRHLKAIALTAVPTTSKAA